MGLDYFRNLALPANQRRCFADQLAVAKTVQKPVFLHEREAFADFSAILGEALPELAGAVWHCFTGTRAQMETLAERGVYFGITGWICDPVRGAELRDIVRHIPDDRLMLESDAPYLTPKTLNPLPRVNEPQYLPEVLRVVAECRGQSEADVARAAASLLALGAKGVVIKGGHWQESGSAICRDWVFLADETFTLDSPRCATPHTHGTGCTFSACITAELAKGAAMADAIRSSKAYISAAIASPLNIGHGHGPVNHWAGGGDDV